MPHGCDHGVILKSAFLTIINCFGCRKVGAILGHTCHVCRLIPSLINTVIHMKNKYKIPLEMSYEQPEHIIPVFLTAIIHYL